MANAAKVPRQTRTFMKAAKESAENRPPKPLVTIWSLFSTSSNVMAIPPMASRVTRRAFTGVSPP